MVTRTVLAGLRRGYRPASGPVTPMHRSIRRLHLPWHRLATGFVLAIVLTAALLACRAAIGESWSHQLIWWMHALELPGRFAMPQGAEPGSTSLPVPLIDLRLRFDGLDNLAEQALVCVIVWVGAGLLPDHLKPGAYLARFAVLVHGIALVYFLFWPARFPHSLSDHLNGGLRQAWALMLITPCLHLFTYYLFPFALWKRVALTLLALAFLYVLTPLQYACHAAVLHALGLVTMPVLYLLFGAMLPILGMVALYGWAMSWDGTADGRSQPDPA